MSKGLLLVLGVGVLYTSGMVVLSRSAVSSVIYLVGTIINGGLILMVLGISLLPLVYVIVYVGGISILFLFVIMMVELNKEKEEGEKKEGISGSVGSLVVGLTILLWGIYIYEGESSGVLTSYREIRWEKSTMGLEMIKTVGYILYSENIMALIVIGLLLLMVMMSLKLLLSSTNSKEV